MGAGCFYTNNETKTKAFWIELEVDEDQNEFDFWYLKTVINNIGYIEIRENEYINGLYSLFLESTYYGDGIVVRLEPNTEDQRLYNLGMANFHKNYQYIAKKLIKDNFKLRIASSGYTSMEYDPS